MHFPRPPLVGRRGAALLFFALIFGTSAFSYLAHPELITQNPNRDLINVLATPQEWGIVFAVTCFVKIVGSVWRRLQPVAFFLGTALWTCWALAYWVEWIQGAGVYPYLAATIYTALAIFNLIIAGWPEPKELR